MFTLHRPSSAAMVILTSLLVGCDAEEPLDADAASMSWEEFLASDLVEKQDEGRWIVEADILVSEAGLRRYYDAHHAADALTPRLWGSNPFGHDNAHEVDRKLNLTYCVSDAFGVDKALIVKRMQEAAIEWERITDVNFIYRPAFDATCTQGTDDAYFAVVRMDQVENKCATAFGPSETLPGVRRLQIFPRIWIEPNCGYATGRLLRHELGHILGFAHEQDRTGCGGTTPSHALSEYDFRSVMGYPVGTVLGACGALSRPSRRDVAGAKFVYSLPKSSWLGRSGASVLRHDSNFNTDSLAEVFWYTPAAGSAENLLGGPSGGMYTNSFADELGTHHRPVVGRFSDEDMTSDLLFYSVRTTQDRVYFTTPFGFAMSDMAITGSQQPILGHFSTTTPLNGRTEIFMYGPGPDSDFVLRYNTMSNVMESVMVSPTIGSNDSYYSAIPGDFDGDGDTDIYFYSADALAANNSTAANSVYMKTTGNVTFTQTDLPHAPLGVTGNNDDEFYWTWATGDFDGDLRHDIFWHTPEPGKNDRMWEGDGAGLPFTDISVLEQTSPDIFKLFTGDFDGNGKTDILWYNQNDGLDANPHTDQIWLMHPNFGTTVTIVPLDIGSADFNVHIADYTGDGLSDLYLWDPNGTDQVRASDGDGTFTTVQTLAGPAGYPVGYGQG